MSQSSLKSARDLLAELDEEFGKKPKKKIEKQLEGKGIIQRSSTGTFSDIAAEANAISASYRNKPGWQAVSVAVHTFTEHCDNCFGKVEYVGNILTTFENSHLRAKVQTRELVTHDDLGFELPVEVDEHVHTVPFCVACLRLSRRVADHMASAFLNGVPKQLTFEIKGEKNVN